MLAAHKAGVPTGIPLHGEHLLCITGRCDQPYPWIGIPAGEACPYHHQLLTAGAVSQTSGPTSWVNLVARHGRPFPATPRGVSGLDATMRVSILCETSRDMWAYGASWMPWPSELVHVWPVSSAVTSLTWLLSTCNVASVTKSLVLTFYLFSIGLNGHRWLVTAH